MSVTREDLDAARAAALACAAGVGRLAAMGPGTIARKLPPLARIARDSIRAVDLVVDHLLVANATEEKPVGDYTTWHGQAVGAAVQLVATVGGFCHNYLSKLWEEWETGDPSIVMQEMLDESEPPELWQAVQEAARKIETPKSAMIEREWARAVAALPQAEPPPHTDPSGPGAPGTWWHDGICYGDGENGNRMPDLPWHLADYLWQVDQPFRTASFDSLGAMVWRDTEPPGLQTVKNAAFDANEFFRQHSIPLKIKTSGGRFPRAQMVSPDPKRGNR